MWLNLYISNISTRMRKQQHISDVNKGIKCISKAATKQKIKRAKADSTETSGN